ncbi:hypothetical protein ABIA39_008556 [Nocardia sp. GAS34]
MAAQSRGSVPSSRCGGTVDTSSDPAPTAIKSAIRFSAAIMPFDDGRNKPLRSRSNSLTRCLAGSGISSSRSSGPEVCGGTEHANCRHNR